MSRNCTRIHVEIRFASAAVGQASACGGPPPAPDSRVDPPRPSRAEEIAPPAHSLIQEMAEMRRQLDKVSAQVSRSATRGRRRLAAPSNPALDDLDELLAAHEISSDLAGSL